MATMTACPTRNIHVSSESEGRPHLPTMIQISDAIAPAAPTDLYETGVARSLLADLVLKVAYTVAEFTTEWAARKVHLPTMLVEELLQELTRERMLQILGQSGPFNYRYTNTGRGRERASRLLEVSGYIGPAPVSLESYAAILEWQLGHMTKVSRERATAAISELVLAEHDAQVAGLAISSGRSLFLSGPPGNGKTTVARLLHNALEGEIWVPHCIAVDHSIIRVFDPQCHERADVSTDQPWTIDGRWVRIRRPLIVVGGELTLDALDLAYSPTLRHYEAPLHFKANGGTLVIDDLGRQRVDSHQLLNRWIIPLEHQIDHLTLHTGQKIDVPFRQMLIFATNLDPKIVADTAFLRRMGYRLHLGNPSPEHYAEILKRYAARHNYVVPPLLIDRLLARYRAEGRELRCCDPGDLIKRVQDICQFRDHEQQLTEPLIDLAWTSYFGNGTP